MNARSDVDVSPSCRETEASPDRLMYGYDWGDSQSESPGHPHTDWALLERAGEDEPCEYRMLSSLASPKAAPP